MRWVVIVIGTLLALVALVALIGVLLPQSHVASSSRTFAHPVDHVLAVISDVRRYPEWRPDVRNVTLLSEQPLRWREDGTSGTVEFEVAERAAPNRLVTAIVSKDLPFGGRWEYDLVPDDSGTRLTITERGEVHNPIFRFMARFIFGYSKTMSDYLAALETYLAREPRIP